MLYVTSIGISTANIIDADNMADILIEKSIYTNGRNNANRDAVNAAVEEAAAVNIAAVIVGGKRKETVTADSFAQALAKIQEETVIICTQTGSDGYPDAAAVVVTREKPDSALAVIMDSVSGQNGRQSRISRLYGQEGPVLDAMAAIECCIAINYGFDFSKDWSGELFLDEDYAKDIPYHCRLSDGGLDLHRFHGETRAITKKMGLMVPVTYKTTDELRDKIEILLKKLQTAHSLEIVKEYTEAYQRVFKDDKTTVFIGSDKKELENEIRSFLKERARWSEPGFSWGTNSGSCYTEEPLSENSKVCYLNPPGGMFSKIQFYRLYRSMPELKHFLIKNRITYKSSNEMISRYYFEIMTIMLTVKVLETIGVRQNTIIGASLGELSVPMIFDVAAANGELMKASDCSLDIMYEVVHMLEDMIEAQTKLSRLYFGKTIEDMEKWYLVCDYKQVKREIENMPEEASVFITIIGSPRDIIICGTHKACMELVLKLHCYATRFQDPIYAHTPVLEPQYPLIRERMERTGLHLAEGLPFDIYRTCTKEKLGTGIGEFAENYADCLVKQVDMPGIFKKAYEDGCRIFIDLGSGMFCGRWAREMFKNDKDVRVLSLFDRKAPRESMLSMMAALMVNRADADIEQFFNWYGKQMEVKSKVDLMKNKTDYNEKREWLETIVSNQIERNQKLLHRYLEYEKRVAEEALREYAAEKECLYDYEHIIEMTAGSMARVLGNIYDEVDKYEVRARMPLPPYLFVSRILSIDAEYGKFKEGSAIEAEYDVPYDCIMRVNRSNVSSVVFSEAAHIGIFLAGYMGIDAFSGGKSKFRITDVTTKYVSEQWPQVGDTIKMKFIIDKLIRNGDITLLICTYKVYLKDELIIDARETGGFFTQQALDKGAGVQGNMLSDIRDADPPKEKQYYPVSSKRKFGRQEIYDFLSGDYRKCFGRNIVNSETPYQVCGDAMFIDEVIDLSETGGKYGLGYIVAKKEIDASYWPFQCHFKNDPVLPGTIMLEGLSQALTFFQTCMGLYHTAKPFVTKMNTGNEVQTKFRGEVKCAPHTLIYRVYPSSVRCVEDGLMFTADGEVYCDGLQVIEQKNASMLIAQRCG